MDANFMDSNLFNYLLLPLMIFFARIMDVTVGTIRIVMVSKGKKNIAPILGFFEVFIWILAMSKIVQNLDNWVCYIFYIHFVIFKFISSFTRVYIMLLS